MTLHYEHTWCADSKLPQADSMFFQRRELCFTLDGDIFVRYQSFKVRPGALESLLIQCQHSQPHLEPDCADFSRYFALALQSLCGALSALTA